MEYLFSSRFYREEALRWLLIGALAVWALSATIFALTKKDSLVVIAVGDDSSYVVKDTNTSRDKKELLNFTKVIVEKLYTFTPVSFDKNLTEVSDLMSADLWTSKRDEYQRLSAKLKVDPLTQTSKIISVDDLGEGRLSLLVDIEIRHKLETKLARLKVELEIKKRGRSEMNPWMYELEGVQDASL